MGFGRTVEYELNYSFLLLLPKFPINITVYGVLKTISEQSLKVFGYKLSQEHCFKNHNHKMDSQIYIYSSYSLLEYSPEYPTQIQYASQTFNHLILTIALCLDLIILLKMLLEFSE